MDRPILWALLAANLVALFTMGIDKFNATRGWRRVPEKNLYLLAALTGAPGIWAGARLFRHKTIKRSFRIRLILASAVNLVWLTIWIWLVWREESG